MLFDGSILPGARPTPGPVMTNVPDPRPVTEWLDRYLEGEFDAVMSAIDQDGEAATAGIGARESTLI